MAPGITQSPPAQSPIRPIKPPSQQPIDLDVFPDGLQTSGQHPPLYERLAPYSAFPKEIAGPTIWRSENYIHNPERWTHPFSDDEISALSTAADAFLARNQPLTGISRLNFTLPPPFAATITSVRNELLDGKGFILFKNFPVREWGLLKSATAYLGLGTHMGYPVSQNGRGHILGHVKDVGDDATRIDRVRIYRTNARQFFHADEGDLVGLLCVARAEVGGESDLASSHRVWNVLQRERPDVAELLTRPIWYFDRKGEVSVGEQECIRTAVFYLETQGIDHDNSGSGGGRVPRVYCKWDPYHVRSLARFSDAGFIPPLSPEQEEAIKVLEETCERVKLHMVLEVGDIQFLSNTHVLHARTAYRDFGPESGMPRRHLMRLWLGTPVREGGWRLPFHDADEEKRGGIQVDNNKPVAKIDAD